MQFIGLQRYETGDGGNVIKLNAMLCYPCSAVPQNRAAAGGTPTETTYQKRSIYMGFVNKESHCGRRGPPGEASAVRQKRLTEPAGENSEEPRYHYMPAARWNP